MDIGAIKTALADAVRTAIPRLNCFGYVPDALPEPCFFAVEADINFDLAFGRGMDEALITCRLLVGRGDDKSGQAALDRYLAGSGPNSIKAALVAARGAPGVAALGGLCDDLHLTRIQGYRMYQHADTYYYGAELTVRVIGEG